MTAERAEGATARAFRLMQALVEAGGAAALHDLADAADLPKPTAHRLLGQLEGLGVVKRDVEGKRYLVGDGLAALAVGAVGALARLAGPRDVMARLVDRLGETCNLGVLDGAKVLYLERVECDKPLRMHLRAGSRVPLHCTAVGKLLLAFAPPAKQALLIGPDEPPRLTPHTLDRVELVAQIRAIRETGVSINREESTLGLTGVAVPVLGASGACLAGLSVHAPASRLDATAMAAAVEPLRAAAAEIAGLLGA
jgi:DNA-binding IclR family transcriptional regulator